MWPTSHAMSRFGIEYFAYEKLKIVKSQDLRNVSVTSHGNTNERLHSFSYISKCGVIT